MEGEVEDRTQVVLEWGRVVLNLSWKLQIWVWVIYFLLLSQSPPGGSWWLRSMAGQSWPLSSAFHILSFVYDLSFKEELRKAETHWPVPKLVIHYANQSASKYLLCASYYLALCTTIERPLNIQNLTGGKVARTLSRWHWLTSFLSASPFPLKPTSLSYDLGKVSWLLWTVYLLESTELSW